jgi:hypothetical protein
LATKGTTITKRICAFCAFCGASKGADKGRASALIGDILSRKAAKIAKTAPFTGYKTDFLRALRLGEKSSLPIPNRPSPCIGILLSCLRVFV